MAELSKLRETIGNWLGLKHGTCYWLARVTIDETTLGLTAFKGCKMDVLLFKEKSKHYVVFYDYLNDYVAFAYDFKTWNLKEMKEDLKEEK